MALPIKFPNVNEMVRMSVVSKFIKILDNQQFEVLGLHHLIKKQLKDSKAQDVYVSHSIPEKIADFYGDLVQGNVQDMVIESIDEGEEFNAIEETVNFNELKEMVYDIAYDQTGLGYAILLARVENGQIIIDQVPQDQYFPQLDGSIIFASYVKRTDADVNADWNDKRNYWLYIQHYSIPQEKVVIERSLWTVNSDGQKAEQITLEKYNPALQPLENLYVDELPIFQIDNGKRRRDGFGRSDFANILPQLSEVNERTTQQAIEFLKNIDAKLQLPKGIMKEDGELKQFDYYEVDKDSPEVKYITNDNQLLDAVDKYIDRQLRFISWATAVPMFEMTGSGAPERVETLRIKMFQAQRKADTKRSNIRLGLKYILRIGLKLAGYSDVADIKVEFSDVLPTDPLTVAQTEAIKVREGLTSKRSSIKRIENYDDDTLDEELALIQSENKIAGIDVNIPPQL